MPENHPNQHLENAVRCAQAGDRSALEEVVRAIQPDVHKLARRFLCCPQDADDASQEILIRVLTGLSNFRGESAFRTWVYRVASNTLLNLRQQHLEQHPLDFEKFAADLANGLSDDGSRLADERLLEEVKIGCTLAMLQCLDRNHRLAYILGEIMEFEHHQAAAVLGITAVAYRKRLSRARADIVTFMHGYCGLVNTDNACRCHKRLAKATQLGRVDPAKLHYATSPQQAKQFPQILAQIRQLELGKRVAALYQSHPDSPHGEDLASWLKDLLAAKPS